MWINDPEPDAARIDELLEKYYSGLMAAFAAGKDISGTPMRVEVRKVAPNRYEATMHLIDAFATFKPIDLRLVIETAADDDARSILRIQVSPKPKEHAIWQSLRHAIADILVRDIPTRAADSPSVAHAPDFGVLSRMVGGEWSTTASTGMTNYRTWHPGPGRHSLRVMTDGLLASRDPWREISVVFWDPGRKRIRDIGVSSVMRGVAEGVITIEGETVRSDIDLHQSLGNRRLRLLWKFEGHDTFHAVLGEASGAANAEYTDLAAWDFQRMEAPNPARSLAVEGAVPSDRISLLMPLVGEWKCAADAAGGNTSGTFEWIPLTDAVYGRVISQDDAGEITHEFDMYWYFHTGKSVLRCLVLTRLGGVFEGDLRVLENGSLKAELNGHDGDRAVVLAIRVDKDHDGTMYHHAWYVDGPKRTPVLDMRKHGQGLR